MKKRSILLLLIVFIMTACEKEKPHPTPTSLALVENEDEQIVLDRQTLKAGDATFILQVSMPYGYKLNNLAALKASVVSDSASVVVDEKWANFEQVEPPLPLQIPLTLTEGQSTITIDLTIYWCEAINESLCFVAKRQVIAPMSVDNSVNASFARAEVLLTPPTY